MCVGVLLGNSTPSCTHSTLGNLFLFSTTSQNERLFLQQAQLRHVKHQIYHPTPSLTLAHLPSHMHTLSHTNTHTWTQCYTV